jgi:hypothetical protein
MEEETKEGQKTRKRSGSPLSRQRVNEVDRLMEAHDARQDGDQELGIGLRSLFLCGLPLRSLKEPVHLRTCGIYTLEILGNPKYGGVPYGQDRLLPIWIATAFVYLGCPEDNLIPFVYKRDILRTLGLSLAGVHYQRLHQGFLRFQHSLFTVSHQVQSPRGRKGLQVDSVPLLSGVRLWDEDPRNPDELDAPHFVRLSTEWAREIREHPVPIDLQTVRALRTHPGALDFYQWQIWRSFTAKRCLRIPLTGKSGLFAQLGCLQDQPPKELRRRLKEWQALIKLGWRDCPNGLSKEGDAFLIHPGAPLGTLHRNRFILRGFPGTPR